LFLQSPHTVTKEGAIVTKDLKTYSCQKFIFVEASFANCIISLMNRKFHGVTAKYFFGDRAKT